MALEADSDTWFSGAVTVTMSISITTKLKVVIQHPVRKMLQRTMDRTTCVVEATEPSHSCYLNYRTHSASILRIY